MSIKVGDIFYSHWGYDQTNTEFMKVIEVSKSGKTVKCQMCSKKRVDIGSTDITSDHCIPTETFGVVFRMHVKVWHDEVTLRGSYPFCQNEWPQCFMFDRAKRFGDARVFKCPKYDNQSDYVLWSTGQKRVCCDKCEHYYEDPQASFRLDTTFKFNGKPVYETALGYGH